MGRLTFEAELPSLSFGDHLEARGDVRCYSWDGVELGPVPDLSKCSMSWEIVTEKTPFEYFEELYQVLGPGPHGENPPNPYVLSGNMAGRDPYSLPKLRRSAGVFWMASEGACTITIARPAGPGFEAFLSAVIANDLRLLVSIDAMFSHNEDTPSPTPAAFLERRRPMFFERAASFTAYRKTPEDLKNERVAAKYIFRHGHKWDRPAKAVT